MTRPASTRATSVASEVAVPTTTELSATDYNRLIALVYELCGIRLGPDKQTLVSSRLASRLRVRQCGDLGIYLDLMAHDHAELVHLLDAITTNTTSFFREAAALNAVDQDVRALLQKGARRFRFWSAAASHGMEAYSLAMLLAESGAITHDCAILATDISTRALDGCRAAVYDTDAVAPIPDALRQRWLKPVGTQWQVEDRLRRLLTINRLNLAKPPFPMRGPFDAIFCRNVMIYFDRPVRQRLVSACHALLRPGGLLLIGAAESLHGLDHSFDTVRPAVYRK